MLALFPMCFLIGMFLIPDEFQNEIMFSFFRHFHDRNLAVMFQTEKEHVILWNKTWHTRAERVYKKNTYVILVSNTQLLNIYSSDCFITFLLSQCRHVK